MNFSSQKHIDFAIPQTKTWKKPAVGKSNHYGFFFFFAINFFDQNKKPS
jgi:hypothetical protein